MDKHEYIRNLCRSAKDASRVIGRTPSVKRDRILAAIAKGLRGNAAPILAANALDLEAGRAAGLSSAMLDRLMLDEGRIEKVARAVEEIMALPDPVGGIEKMKLRPSGIRVGQMRVPVGVVAVIYESRPNVTVDIAALCIKSGNAAVLRGGKESINSNRALYAVIRSSIEKEGVSGDIVRLVEDTDRELLSILLKQDAFIDIVIPRGGRGLIDTVTEQSRIPVIKHDKGVCHTFIDASAEKEMAERISINAKVSRPGVCNAMETLLVHKDYPFTKELFSALEAKGVELRGCELSRKIVPSMKPATEEDWDTEYLELILSVKIVASMDEAVEHITRWSSGHSEAIVTRDYANSEQFLRDVDSAAVFINASTRFHDGGEFGLGAEVGISTQKLHARGAMGMEGLTCLKYVVYGDGQVRE